MNATEHLTLRELLGLPMQKHEDAIDRLTHLAPNEGFKVNQTTFGQLRNGSYKHGAPADETIRAIAYLAGVEDSVAFTAAGQPVPCPPLADELPPGGDNLSPKSRKAVVEMVRVLVDIESSNHAEHARPENQPATSTWSSIRPLRTVAPEDDPRPGQKTEPDDDIVEFHSAEAQKYQAPPIEPLAAHPKVKTRRDQLDEHTGECDVENQDPGRDS